MAEITKARNATKPNSTTGGTPTMLPLLCPQVHNKEDGNGWSLLSLTPLLPLAEAEAGAKAKVRAKAKEKETRAKARVKETKAIKAKVKARERQQRAKVRRAKVSPSPRPQRQLQLPRLHSHKLQGQTTEVPHPLHHVATIGRSHQKIQSLADAYAFVIRMVPARKARIAGLPTLT